MKPYKANTRNDLPRIAEVLGLNGEEVKDMLAVSAVLPFKVNNYVLENLIDRSNLPNDPMYQLTVPQRGMLADADFKRMRDLVDRDASTTEIKLAAREIQASLNPHPAGQQELNKPMLDGAIEQARLLTGGTQRLGNGVRDRSEARATPSSQTQCGNLLYGPRTHAVEPISAGRLSGRLAVQSLS